MQRKILVYSCMLFIIFSCTNKRKQMLIGEWKLVADSVTCTNPEEDARESAKRGAFISGEDAVAEEGKQSVARGEKLVFKDDGTYTQSLGAGNLSGKYLVKDSGLILTENFMDIVIGFYTIHSITDSTLTMTMGIDMRGHSHKYKRKFVKLSKG